MAESKTRDGRCSWSNSPKLIFIKRTFRRLILNVKLNVKNNLIPLGNSTFTHGMNLELTPGILLNNKRNGLMSSSFLSHFKCLIYTLECSFANASRIWKMASLIFFCQCQRFQAYKISWTQDIVRTLFFHIHSGP